LNPDPDPDLLSEIGSSSGVLDSSGSEFFYDQKIKKNFTIGKMLLFTDAVVQCYVY
jgi:hypothetical protein